MNLGFQPASNGKSESAGSGLNPKLRDLGCAEVSVPHGRVRPFHQKSNCLTQLTFGQNVVQVWSRDTLKLRDLGLEEVSVGVSAFH